MRACLRESALCLQVDALRDGLLGKTRNAFSKRYCDRKTVPVGKSGAHHMSYDNSGLSHGKELHMLLKKVPFLQQKEPISSVTSHSIPMYH